MPTNTDVTKLKINSLTEAQFDAAVQSGVIGANEISFITDLDEAIQVNSLPTADASQEGKIYQYIGDTDTNFSNGYFYKCMANSTEIVSGTASVEEYINHMGETPDPENIPTFIFNKEVFDEYIKNQGKPANTGTRVKFSIWMDPDEAITYVKAEYNSGDFILTEVTNDYGSEMNAAYANIGFTTNFCPVEERDPTDEEYEIVDQQIYFNGGYIIVSLPTNNTYAWTQIDVQPAPEALPDQTGQSGKFLTTDGTDASWSDKPLVNDAVGARSIAIGNGSSGSSIYTTMLGTRANGDEANFAVGIGDSVRVSGGGSIAIGYSARTNAAGTIQLNTSVANATNSDANTFKVANTNGNFEIMSADGTIPEARLADTTSATQGQVLTLNANGNAEWANPSTGGPTSLTVTLQGGSSNWASNTQTVTVQGVTATNTIFAGAAPASVRDYDNAGIICVAQNTDELTFECVTVPTNDITVNVLIIA